MGVDIERNISEFRELGYTVIERHFEAGTVSLLRSAYDRFAGIGVGVRPGHSSWWLSNLTENDADLFVPIVSDETLIEFAERLMGPCVQLDNLTLSGFPSVPVEEAEGKVSGWHRDRWAHVPRGDQYFAPLAINAILYLQDLTDANGPFRALPGSHRRQFDVRDARLPLPGEVVLYPRAGDVVIIHNCLLHSGTPNWSGDTRYFFSVYYNRSWLKTTDDHSGPNVQRLVAKARENGDVRLQRLFGVDDHLAARSNWGFRGDEEAQWETWRAAERANVAAIAAEPRTQAVESDRLIASLGR